MAEESRDTVQVTTRLPQEEAALLIEIANNEKRSLSNMLAVIVAEYCRAKLIGN